MIDDFDIQITPEELSFLFIEAEDVALSFKGKDGESGY